LRGIGSNSHLMFYLFFSIYYFHPCPVPVVVIRPEDSNHIFVSFIRVFSELVKMTGAKRYRKRRSLVTVPKHLFRQAALEDLRSSTKSADGPSRKRKRQAPMVGAPSPKKLALEIESDVSVMAISSSEEDSSDLESPGEARPGAANSSGTVVGKRKNSTSVIPIQKPPVAVPPKKIPSLELESVVTSTSIIPGDEESWKMEFPGCWSTRKKNHCTITGFMKIDGKTIRPFVRIKSHHPVVKAL